MEQHNGQQLRTQTLSCLSGPATDLANKIQPRVDFSFKPAFLLDSRRYLTQVLPPSPDMRYMGDQDGRLIRALAPPSPTFFHP